MTYFSKFPVTDYEFNGTQSVVQDILRRSSFVSEYKPLSDLFFPYLVGDGESAQSVALRFYGSVYYHWVIYIFNEIHDPSHGWPLSSLDVEALCLAKYGSDMYRVRHYERNGNIVGEYKEFIVGSVWVPPVSPAPLDLLTLPVSFYDYEQELNDKKRQIRIMRPELLSSFVAQFEDSISG